VRVKFQVDVEHLQLSFQAEPGGRAFLLAAERSQIVTCGIGAEVHPALKCTFVAVLVMYGSEMGRSLTVRMKQN